MGRIFIAAAIALISPAYSWAVEVTWRTHFLSSPFLEGVFPNGSTVRYVHRSGASGVLTHSQPGTVAHDKVFEGALSGLPRDSTRSMPSELQLYTPLKNDHAIFVTSRTLGPRGQPSRLSVLTEDGNYDHVLGDLAQYDLETLVVLADRKSSTRRFVAVSIRRKDQTGGITRVYGLFEDGLRPIFSDPIYRRGLANLTITDSNLVQFPGLPSPENPHRSSTEQTVPRSPPAQENQSLAGIPFSTSDVELNIRGTPVHSRFSLEHQNVSYELLSFKYRDQERRPGVTGETFIRRQDGRLIRINHVYIDFSTQDRPTIPDGILNIPGSPRRVDLNQFNAEARFQSEPMGEVKNSEEQRVNPMRELERRYEDLVQTLGRSPSETFPVMDAQSILSLRTALQRAEAGSVALIGPAGSGKTELVRSFATSISRGAFPEIPRTTRVLVIDPATMGSGGRYVSIFESHVKVIKEACRVVRCILFIDEIHSMRGQGTHASNTNDFFELIKPELSSGRIRIIGTSTEAEFFAAFSGDPALMRRFTVVTKSEPGRAEALEMVQSWIRRFGRVEPSLGVIEYAMRLADQFNALGSQPARTTSLIDDVYAWLDVNGRFDEAPSRQDVESAVQRRFRVDPAHFDLEAMRAMLSLLPNVLDDHIIGQRSLKETLVELAVQAYTGAQDPGRPSIRLLVAGPPGTGKTETATVFAQAMGLPFTRIEMNRYALGDPQAFLAELAQSLRVNAMAVIVLDELEKAHPIVQRAVLALLDQGRFTVTENINSTVRSGTRTVQIDARRATIIATTNAGQESLRERGGIGFGSHPTQRSAGQIPREELRNALIADGIPEPVVDRFQDWIAALPPSREEFREVLQLHLRRALDEQTVRQEIQRITLVNEGEFLDAMLRAYYQDGISNRVAHQITQRTIRSAVARAKLSGHLTGERPTLELRFDPDASPTTPGDFRTCIEAVKR